MATSVELFAKAMCPTLLNALAPNEPIKVVELDVRGPRPLKGLFLESSARSWLSHPRVSDVAAELTSRGVNWFVGASTSRAVGVVKQGRQVVVGAHNGAMPLAYNNAAPTLTQSVIESAMASAGYTVAWARARYLASALATQNMGQLACNVDHPDYKLLDTAMRNLFRVLGFKPLDDVPSRCVNEVTWGTISGSPAVYTPPTQRVDDFYRAGVKYCSMLLSTSTSTSAQVHFNVPVLDDGGAQVTIGWNNVMTGVGPYPTTTMGSPVSGIGSYHNGFAPGTYLDVPPHYKTDVLGRVATVADFPNVYVPKAVLPPELRNAFQKVGRVNLLPLAGPIGDASFFYRSDETQVTMSSSEHTAEVTNPATGVKSVVPVVITKVVMEALDVLSSVGSSWYEKYLSTGYGYYQGLGDAAAAEKMTAIAELAGYTHSAVYMRLPVSVPRDIVTRLEIYANYKRAREKHCLSNDFMSLKFDAKRTWGQINDECNKFTSLSALYGISSVTPSSLNAQVVPNMSTKTYMVTTSTTVHTVMERDNGVDVGPVYENRLDEMALNVRLGAVMGGEALNLLCANWGYDYARVWAEANAAALTASDIARSSSGAFRGRGQATGDFAWESLGISGFPLVREMTVQDGYKAIIHSICVIGNKTEPLHKAYLGFGEAAMIGDLIQ